MHQMHVLQLSIGKHMFSFFQNMSHPDDPEWWVSTLKIHVSLLDVEGLGDGPLLSLRYQAILKWGKCIWCNPWISFATN